jgi:hypothetical protein
MILKITFWKQIKSLATLLFITSLYVGFLIYAEIPLEKKSILIFLIPYLVFFFIPVAVLHLNYYINGIGILYKIDESGITKIANNKEEVIPIADIKEITFFMMPNKAKDSAGRELPFEDYYYVQILTKNEKVIFISSLFSTKIDKIIEVNFKDLKIKKLKAFYPLISA